MTETHGLSRPQTHPAQAVWHTRLHYLIFGLAIGGLWLLNLHASLLQHAVQMLAVMSVLTGIQIVLDRRRRHGAPAPRGTYARLIGFKLLLVAVAVGAEWLLAPVTHQSTVIVAAGLVVLVTALGPRLDSQATTQTTPVGGPDRARP